MRQTITEIKSGELKAVIRLMAKMDQTNVSTMRLEYIAVKLDAV